MSIFNKKDQKTFSLSEEQLSELVFYARMKKEKEIELAMWDAQLKGMMSDLMITQSLKPTEWSVDWPRAIREGKMIATKIPQPKVEMGPEERRPDGAKKS